MRLINAATVFIRARALGILDEAEVTFFVARGFLFDLPEQAAKERTNRVNLRVFCAVVADFQAEIIAATFTADFRPRCHVNLERFRLFFTFRRFAFDLHKAAHDRAIFDAIRRPDVEQYKFCCRVCIKH